MRPLTRALSAVPALLLLACNENAPLSSAPLRADGGAVRATLASNGLAQRLRSNRIKYRDNGQKPAIGVSGASIVAARALIAKTGETTLEVTTTGSFEGDGTVTATMKKVEVTRLMGTDAMWTQKYKLKDVAYASYRYPDLVRGSQLRIRAHIDGVGNGQRNDNIKNDVVALVETAKLRPDLRVEQLQIPGRVVVGAPTRIGALISEANGDVGARADCVLYVDGAAADRSRGIWVDAKDAVLCKFVQHFLTPGARRLEVRLEHVTPADYDDANNTAAAAVNVVYPNDFYYTARADQYFEQGMSDYSLRGEMLPGDPNFPRVMEEHGTRQRELFHQSMVLNATMPAASATSPPPPVTDFTLSLTIGGTAVLSMRLGSTSHQTYSYQRGGIAYDCLEQFDGYGLQDVGNHHHVSICSYRGTASDGTPLAGTSVDYVTAGRKAVYFSAAWTQGWHLPDADPSEYENYEQGGDCYCESGWFPYTTFGTSIAIDLSVTSGGVTYRSDPRMTLVQQAGFSREFDKSCSFDTGWGRAYTRCVGPGWERSSTMHAETTGVPDLVP